MENQSYLICIPCVHVSGDMVMLKNLKLHKTNQSSKSTVYLEHSRQLEGSRIEIWGDGNRRQQLIETKEVHEVHFCDSTVHGFTAECNHRSEMALFSSGLVTRTGCKVTRCRDFVVTMGNRGNMILFVKVVLLKRILCKNPVHE